MRETRYEDDSKGNEHILKLWTSTLQQMFPDNIVSIQKIPESDKRNGSFLIKVADGSIGGYSILSAEVHTESYENYARFKRKGRILVQYYKKEKKRIYGETSILGTKADLFFHGWRNRDPAKEATAILEPIFFWTGKLRRYVSLLQMHYNAGDNTDKRENPPYFTLSNKKSYDGFRISSWTPVTQLEIQRGEVDTQWTLTDRTTGITNEKIFTVGIKLPLKDVLDCATDNPFAPSLMSYGGI